MANDFIRIATPNISNSSNTTIYAVPAGSSSAALESIVIGITCANKSNSGVTMKMDQMMSILSEMLLFLQVLHSKSCQEIN